MTVKHLPALLLALSGCLAAPVQAENICSFNYDAGTQTYARVEVYGWCEYYDSIWHCDCDGGTP